MRNVHKPKLTSDPLNNILTMIPCLDTEQKIVIEKTLQSMLVDTIRKLQQEKQLHSTTYLSSKSEKQSQIY